MISFKIPDYVFFAFCGNFIVRKECPEYYLYFMANKLINEQSPYLLQHAHNPVNWYPWGDEAFEIAKEAHKPVIVSIGYAACHWCHVMEHESFEDEATAAYMNEHFVCIKVDREEHPDVDHMYMDAVQAIGGSGSYAAQCICNAGTCAILRRYLLSAPPCIQPSVMDAIAAAYE